MDKEVGLKEMTYEIKDTGDHRKFNSGAQRDQKTDKGRFDLLQWYSITAQAIHMQKGAKKYEARNWEKGMPASEYADSAGRHYAQFMMGLTDENHLASAIWNLNCLYETIHWIKIGKLPEELWDLPYPIPEYV